VPLAIESEHLPTNVGYDAKLQSGQDPGENDEHADELPQTITDSLCRNSLLVQTHSFIGCPVSDDPVGEQCLIWRSWAGVVTCGLQL
jgi:hypothetical protein